MSKIYVAEFGGLSGDKSDVIALPVPPIAEQNVTVSAGNSQITTAFNPLTKYIEISTDTTCSIAIGPMGATTASLINCRLQPNERIVRRIPFNITTTANQQVLYGICTTANV